MHRGHRIRRPYRQMTSFAYVERVVCLAAPRAVVLVSAHQPEPQTPVIEVSLIRCLRRLIR